MSQDKEYFKQYYIKNKERILERNKEWQSKNKEKMVEYSRKYKSASNPKYLEYCDRNYEQWILNSAKHHARNKGIPFNLELSDIVIPEICPYLGHKLTKIRGSGQLETNASIDKINPTLGYIKGNIQIISRQANRMKNNATPEQLVFFAKRVLELSAQDIFISKYND